MTSITHTSTKVLSLKQNPQRSGKCCNEVLLGNFSIKSSIYRTSYYIVVVFLVNEVTVNRILRFPLNGFQAKYSTQSTLSISPLNLQNSEYVILGNFLWLLQQTKLHPPHVKRETFRTFPGSYIANITINL